MPAKTSCTAHITALSHGSKRLNGIIRMLLADLRDIVVPEVQLCFLCGKQLPPPALPFPTVLDQITGTLCMPCMDRLAWVQSPLCTRCGRPWRHGPLCRFCASGANLLYGCSTFVYADAVRELIHALKFRAATELGPPLGYIMGATARFATHWYPHVVVPVPLHSARMEERGFNQADLLAAGVAKALGRAVMPQALERTRSTVPQSMLNPSERLQNVKGAFVVPKPSRIAGRRVLLVDDIRTTGATLAAAGDALLRAGAVSVRCATLAVTVSSDDLCEVGASQ